MQYGICDLAVAPLRSKPSDTSEMVSQLLYGDHFTVLERWQSWCRIRLAFDGYEGWIDTKQFVELQKEGYRSLEKTPPNLVTDLIGFSTDKNKNRILVPLGANINGIHYFEHHFDGNHSTIKKEKTNFTATAFLYLNAPYLWGGKTPFGIDCSGLTQMVYKLNGHKLFRDASQQVEQGETLASIEESEPGDLAFFDNDGGKIIHVGIIMKDNYIVHAHGKVRMDRLDRNGIFNMDSQTYTHKLNIIKKIV